MTLPRCRPRRGADVEVFIESSTRDDRTSQGCRSIPGTPPNDYEAATDAILYEFDKAFRTGGQEAPTRTRSLLRRCPTSLAPPEESPADRLRWCDFEGNRSHRATRSEEA